MSGTEKQVAWANDIKARKMADFQDLAAEFERLASAGLAAGKATPAQTEAGRAKLMNAIAKAEAIEEARFWIDNRATVARYILRDLASREAA